MIARSPTSPRAWGAVSSSTTSLNVTIENSVLSYDNYGVLMYGSNGTALVNDTCLYDGNGIQLNGYCDNSTVANNTCSDGTCGIYLWNADDNNTIVNNTCEENQNEGICLNTACDNNTVTNDRVNDDDLSDNYGGVSIYSSNYNLVENNTCGGNYYGGIYLTGSNYNTMRNNTCDGNYWFGIYLSSEFQYRWFLWQHRGQEAFATIMRPMGPVRTAISGGSTFNNNIGQRERSRWYHPLLLDRDNERDRNTCDNNGYSPVNYIGNNGIYVVYSNGYNISNNVVENNQGYGIYLTGSDGFTIYGNLLVGNNNVTNGGDNVQAYDDSGNTWNTATMGNYWGDWQSPAENGIVTVPYLIDGGSGAQDNMPMVAVTVSIMSPSSPYYTGVSTVNVTGTASDALGNSMNVTWYNEANGAYGNCSGTSSWYADIPLMVGYNNITVNVTDSMASWSARTSPSWQGQ